MEDKDKDIDKNPVDEKLNRYLKIAGAAALTLIIVYLIRLVAGDFVRNVFSTIGIIITSFIVAYLLSILLEPVMKLLEKVKISNSNVRAGIVTIFFLLIVIGIIMIVIMPALKSLVDYAQANDIVGKVKSTYIKFLEILPSPVADYLKEYTSDIGGTLSKVNLEKITPYIVKALGGMLEIILTIVYTFLFLFFMLKERKRLIDSFQNVIPAKYIAHYENFTKNSEKVFREYIKGYFTVILSLFMISFITFLIIGGVTNQGNLVKYALLFALILALTDLVPYIGPFIGAVVVMIISAILLNNFYIILAIGIALIVFQAIEGLILQPVIMGNRVLVHPLGIFTAMLLFTAMGFGVMGVILAAPVASLIKLTYNYIKSEKVSS
ncbi:MAG: AI-2E family transporter [Christensenellales bacterium]|jgi:predicted PurR-regulated permease PerM